MTVVEGELVTISLPLIEVTAQWPVVLTVGSCVIAPQLLPRVLPKSS
jgi:hypothetical protein